MKFVVNATKKFGGDEGKDRAFLEEYFYRMKMGSDLMLSNEMTERLKIKYPIIQAPMAGGVTTVELVAAVSRAGGLGMIGAGYMKPEQMRNQIREVKKLTSKPFGVNLFVPNVFEVSVDEIQAANQLLNPLRKGLNLPPKEFVEVPGFEQLSEAFRQQVQVVREESVPVCSFTFGIPSYEVIEELKQANILLAGTATTVEEAIVNEKRGMDMVVIQGSEAGGHRGNFLQKNDESSVGLMSLIPQAADHVSIPVIAAGGIMDGRGVMAAICLGAMGVQMGTAFLTCEESGALNVHKEAVLQAKESETVLTRSFSGKWARGINNKFIQAMQEKEKGLPDFPVQNTLTQDIRRASGEKKEPDYLSLWSGQSPRLARKVSAASLLEMIISEAEGIKSR